MKFFTHIRNMLAAGALIVAAYSVGTPVQAAQIMFSTAPAPAAGKPFTIEVRLNTQDDAINAAEGSVTLSGLDVQSVSTGGSALSLWPVAPQYSLSTHSIEFAGGLPGSIAAGEDILLFTIVAQAPVGSYPLSAAGVRVFKADGRGTPVAVAAFSKKVAVAAAGGASPAAVKDTTAPQFVSVEVGHDPSLFDGQTYLSFFATDDQSGVTSYEVREGWLGGYKKADRYYVLADQTQGHDVWVRATDAAGNTTIKKISAVHGSSTLWWWLGGILLLVAAGYMYRSRRKKRRY